MSLDTLTHGLFDYAGMFPPAALDFEDALRESAGFATALHRPGLVAADIVLTPEHWGKLDDAALDVAGFEGACTVCIVGVKLDDAENVAQAIAARNQSDDRTRVVALEVSGELNDDTAGTLRRIRATSGVSIFYEPAGTDSERIPDAANLLHGLRSDGAPVGLKLRCAGPTACSADELAAAIREVAARRLPFKLTQGLHHPFAADERYGNDHGFLNVLTALRLHQTVGLDGDELVQCIEDPEPAHFVVTDGLGWNQHRAMMQRVVDAAGQVPFSIGSCSLSEPDEDLQELYG